MNGNSLKFAPRVTRSDAFFDSPQDPFQRDTMIERNYPADFNALNASPMDDKILFDPASHEYTYSDTGEKLHSVTNLISSFFPPFNVRSWAEYKSRSLGTTVQE